MHLNALGSQRLPSPRLSAWVVALMLAMVSVPAGVTLMNGPLTRKTPDGWFQSNPARLYLEPAPVPRPHYGDRLSN